MLPPLHDRPRAPAANRAVRLRFCPGPGAVERCATWLAVSRCRSVLAAALVGHLPALGLAATAAILRLGALDLVPFKRGVHRLPLARPAVHASAAIDRGIWMGCGCLT